MLLVGFSEVQKVLRVTSQILAETRPTKSDANSKGHLYNFHKVFTLTWYTVTWPVKNYNIFCTSIGKNRYLHCFCI